MEPAQPKPHPQAPNHPKCPRPPPSALTSDHDDHMCHQSEGGDVFPGQAAPCTGKPPDHCSVAHIVTHVSSDHTRSHTHTHQPRILCRVPSCACTWPGVLAYLPGQPAPSQPRAVSSTAGQRSARSHPCRELDPCFLSVLRPSAACSRGDVCSALSSPPSRRRPRAQSQETQRRTDEGVAGAHP